MHLYAALYTIYDARRQSLKVAGRLMILETIAIRTVWGKIWAALKSVPWFVWVGVAVVSLWFIDRNAQYREGFENGRTEVMEELRTAQAKAAENALKAAAQADEKALERAEAEAEIIERQLEAIERAEANDENPLDALFR